MALRVRRSIDQTSSELRDCPATANQRPSPLTATLCRGAGLNNSSGGVRGCCQVQRRTGPRSAAEISLPSGVKLRQQTQLPLPLEAGACWPSLVTLLGLVDSRHNHTVPSDVP